MAGEPERQPRVILRPLTAADVSDAYVLWYDDPAVNRFLDMKGTTRESSIAYAEHGRATNSYFMYAILAADTGTHIGNLKIGPISWFHMTSNLVTVIGHPDFRRRGYGAAAVRAGSRLAFEEYAMRKLASGVIQGNTASLKAYIRSGWVVEGVLKGQHLLNGEPCDHIAIACFNPQMFGPDLPQGIVYP